MKTKSLTRVVLLTVLILALALLALVVSPYTRADSEREVAAAETLPTISTGNVEVLRGKYFTVDVILSDNTLGLTSLDLFLDYDPTVMTLVKYDTTKANGYVRRGSALSSLGFNTSNFASSEGMNVRPVQFLWNGTDPDYSNGTLVTLRFKSISSSDESLLGKHYFTLSYRAYNTFRTTPKAEGGHIIYQEVDLEPGFVDVTAGKFQCTYFDWDGSEIVHYEENDFSLFTPVEPTHPARASTRTHYFTYGQDDWDATNPWTEDMEEPESINWEITALYIAHAQPYTVYYYFGEKDSETGVVTMGETAADYYYTWNTEGETPVKDYCLPKSSKYGDAIIFPAQYTEAYYSLSPWFIDSACTEELLVSLVPEDTSVDAATVAALPIGEAAPADTFKLKLYAYRQQNEDVVPPEDIEVTASKVENVVTVDGTTVTVDITLTKNFGIMSMLLTLDYDRTCLTLTKVERGEAFPSDVFSFTNNEYLPEGYNADPFRLYWSNSSGNYYGTGVIATLTYTLDPNATVGDHLVTVTYTEKQDVTRYYDATAISGTPVPAMLWYTTLNVVDGYVTLREVTAPTAHEGNYYFNKTEQTYTFATNGGIEDYDIVTSNKRTLHGTQTVTVSLKGEDNVYRFWAAEEGRPRADKDFTFEILKRSVAIPTASSVTYTYNHEEQTYAFDDVGGAGYYTATDTFKRTLVGSQTITCSLDYPEESYWGEDEADIADKLYTFEIKRLRVAKPVSAGNSYVYDTTEQTYAFTTYGGTAYYTMAEGSDKRTASGSQTITCTLKDKSNYCWDAAGDPTGDLAFTFTIAKRSITAPTAHDDVNSPYVYTGSEKTYLFAAEPQEDKALYYSVSGDKRTLAGSQDVTVTLLHKEDTYWGENEEDTEDKTYLFTVKKQEVIPPTASEQVFVFNLFNSTSGPTEHTYVFSAEMGDSTLYTVDAAAMTKWQSGTTYIAVALKDKANYKWSTTGLSADLSYAFTVDKKAVVKPVPNAAFTESYVYDGSKKTFYLSPAAPYTSLEKKYYTVENDERTNAGTYTGEDAVTITLKYPDHSYWADSEPQSSEALSYDFVIAKAQVERPTAHSGEYRYTGEMQTYTFAQAGGSELYTVSGNKRTDAGSQTVTVTLGDNKANYAWKRVGEEPLSSDDLEFTFTILPQQVTVPSNKIEQGSPKVYTFTGSPIQAEFNSALQTDLYDVEGDSQTSSGTHKITFTLKLNTEEQKNYCWSDDNSFAPKQIDFTIKKRVISAPTGSAQVVTYNGSAQSYLFSYEDTSVKGVYYTCDDQTKTDAGVYTVTCALVYPEDTYWNTAVDDVADKTFSFTIEKKSIGVISVEPKTYDGTRQYSGVEDTDDYTVTPGEGGVEAGSYPFTVTLANANYRWSDGDETLARVFYFTISSVANYWTDGPTIAGWTYVYGVPGTPGTAQAAFGEVDITYHASGSSVYTHDLPVNAGNYAARFYVPATVSYSELLIEKSFTIGKATLDMSEVAWDYEGAFTYDGLVHTVAVTGLPAEFTDRPQVFYSTYEDDSKVDRGDYTARVTFTYDSVNYKADYGENVFSQNCAYTIDPCEVTILWSKQASYVFTGEALTIPTAKYVDVNEADVPVTVAEKYGNEFLAAGSYRFEATVVDPNYVAKAGTDTVDVNVAKLAITAPTSHDDVLLPYVYTGSEQTYAFAAGFDAKWMTVSGDKRTVVGTQAVTVELIDKINTYWAGTEESVAALTNYTFTIVKAEVDKPTATALTYTYTGSEQSYVFATAGDSDLYEVAGDTRTAHGSQSVTVSLLDGDNYRWTGGDSEPLAFTFTILKLAVTAPTADETAYVYDGTLKTYTFASAGDSARFTPSNTTRTKAGSQTVKVVLNNKSDTYWADTEEDTGDLSFIFSIAKAQVKAPTADETAFVYDGNEKNYTFGNTADSALYAISGAQTKVSSGTTDLTVTLIDAEDYRWAEGDSEPLVFHFTVAKLAVTAPTADETAYVYDGTVKTYTFKVAGDSAWFTVDNTTRTDAGSQDVTVSLKNKADTYWKDTEEMVEDVVFPFNIAKAEVTAPTASTLNYVYNGAEQTYAFATAGDEALYTVGAKTMTRAGSMNVVVSLKVPANYRWKGTESSDAINFAFIIAPAKVAKPAKDTTKFYCNGSVQTYTVAPSPYYIVSGASKSEHGTTNVVISLNDTDNYVWDNAPEADSSEDLLYPFTIEHDFKNKYALAEYKAADADCTHSATYYFVCDCGEVGTEVYEVGDPLGHLYEVAFDWGTPETVDGADSYSEVYANVTCTRCDHAERVKADLTVEVTPPGKANGLRKYTATVTLDHPYTDIKEVVLKAIYHNYGEPIWAWSVGEDGYPVVKATFPCIDEGAEHLKIELDAVVTPEDTGVDTFDYVATVYFYEKPYVDRRQKAKPTLTFISGDAAEDIVTYYVLPNDVVTSLIPAVPTKEGAVFLKWWDAEASISLVFGENGYTPFVMRDADRLFTALWRSVGQITVAVSDVDDQNFEGCVVELKQGNDTIGTLTTDESGTVSFDGLEYGNYSIVVTYTDGITVTYTTGTVLGQAEKTVPVKMSEKRFNTEVNDEDSKNVSVENLENTVPEEDKAQIVTAGQEGDVAEITVVLSVINETDATVVQEMTELIEASNNTVVDLSDIRLIKTVTVVDENGGETSLDPDYITTSDVLVDITFPITEDIYAALASVHGSVDNVLVAKRDGSAVSFMTKLTEDVALASEEECFYVTEKDGVPYVVVRTKSFSTTYGLCVSGVSIGADNKIETFDVHDWTYGDTPKPATATSTYGTPTIYYQVNGEWVTTLPTKAGTYNVKAVVEETTEYKGVEAGAQMTIAKAKYDTSALRFEDLTVLYDGEVHSILVEGLPEGVTVNYENNGQVDVGEYTVTVYFVCDVNYEQIAPMTAVLRITEEESTCKCLWLWILLAVFIVEAILFIILFMIGKKYKKKYEEEKERQEKGSSMSAMLFMGLSSVACLTINIVLFVLDIILLALIVWRLIQNHKYKKMYEQLLEKAEAKDALEEKGEDAPAEEAKEDAPADDDRGDKAE